MPSTYMHAFFYFVRSCFYCHSNEILSLNYKQTEAFVVSVFIHTHTHKCLSASFRWNGIFNRSEYIITNNHTAKLGIKIDPNEPSEWFGKSVAVLWIVKYTIEPLKKCYPREWNVRILTIADNPIRVQNVWHFSRCCVCTIVTAPSKRACEIEVVKQERKIKRKKTMPKRNVTQHK